LVGVLTVYSTIVEGFTDDHRRLLEVVARHVSGTIRQAREASELSTQPIRDNLPNLPARERVERFVAAEITHATNGEFLSIVLIRLATQSHRAGDRNRASDKLMSLVMSVGRMLRGGDILARYSENEFVVVLTQTDTDAASSVATRIADVITDLYADCAVSERPTFAFATAPDDGGTLAALVASAHKRQDPSKPTTRPPAIH
jgi:PleD family two-component response regulator